MFTPRIALCALALTSACSFRQLTADQTADMIHASSAQANTLEDLDFAEEATPGNLLTMESVYRVSPHNPDILIELTQGYTGYSFAFLEDRAERALAHDDPDGSDHYRARARAAYRRGQMFGFALMNEIHATNGGPDAVVRAGIEPWRRYLANFTSRDDVPALFWTGNAWLSRIQQSLDDPGTLLDVPFAVAMMERARTLDPEFYYGGIHMVFGLYYASTPRELGGRPDLARTEFEAALRATNRRLLINQVMYARSYAVQVQDRALYRRLLQEVLDAGDVMPTERLTNLVAKRRAQRYLAQIDDLFPPESEPTPATAPGATP